MKANELMIGDYVMFLGKVRKIKSLVMKDTGIEISFEGKNRVVVSLDVIEPIHLTPEILEKNGFVPNDFSPYYLPIEDGSIRFSEHQYGLYCNILRPYQRYDGVCNYVHQFQHALRLCGIEKEIMI